MRKLIPRPSRSTAQTNATKKEPIIMCFHHFSLSFLILSHIYTYFTSIFQVFSQNPRFFMVFSHHPQPQPPPKRNAASASRVRPALHRRRGPAQLGVGGARPGGAQAIGDPRRLSMTVMAKYPKYLSKSDSIPK